MSSGKSFGHEGRCCQFLFCHPWRGTRSGFRKGEHRSVETFGLHAFIGPLVELDRVGRCSETSLQSRHLPISCEPFWLSNGSKFVISSRGAEKGPNLGNREYRLTPRQTIVGSSGCLPTSFTTHCARTATNMGRGLRAVRW